LANPLGWKAEWWIIVTGLPMCIDCLTYFRFILWHLPMTSWRTITFNFSLKCCFSAFWIVINCVKAHFYCDIWWIDNLSAVILALPSPSQLKNLSHFSQFPITFSEPLHTVITSEGVNCNLSTCQQFTISTGFIYKHTQTLPIRVRDKIVFFKNFISIALFLGTSMYLLLVVYINVVSELIPKLRFHYISLHWVSDYLPLSLNHERF